MPRLHFLHRDFWHPMVATMGCFAALVVLFEMESKADTPEPLNRLGRFCGWGWSDGYHACRSSGLQPLADLPPKSFASRSVQSPSVGFRAGRGVHPSAGATFYDQIDALNRQRRGQLQYSIRLPSPKTSIDDPESFLIPGAQPIWNVPGYATSRANEIREVDSPNRSESDNRLGPSILNPPEINRAKTDPQKPKEPPVFDSSTDNDDEATEGLDDAPEIVPPGRPIPAPDPSVSVLPWQPLHVRPVTRQPRELHLESKTRVRDTHSARRFVRQPTARR